MKRFHKYPKLIHNLWSKYEHNKDHYYLTVSHGKYEVPEEDADLFITKIRKYCTGHKTIEEISHLAKLPIEKISSIVQSFEESQLLYNDSHLTDGFKDDLSIANKILSACRIWSEQLSETYITKDIADCKSNKDVIIGFIFETYHYIKKFPLIIEAAKRNSQDHEIINILSKYENEETGHEYFPLKSLELFGYSKNEIESCVPLVSTNNIINIMFELVKLDPNSIFCIAAIIEAAEFDLENIEHFNNVLQDYYSIDKKCFEPIFKHMSIDFDCGHAYLFENNLTKIRFDRNNINSMINLLHDLKHAFDLQKLEIINYYNKPGNYVPRQFVDYGCI